MTSLKRQIKQIKEDKRCEQNWICGIFIVSSEKKQIMK